MISSPVGGSSEQTNRLITKSSDTTSTGLTQKAAVDKGIVDLSGKTGWDRVFLIHIEPFRTQAKDPEKDKRGNVEVTTR